MAKQQSIVNVDIVRGPIVHVWSAIAYDLLESAGSDIGQRSCDGVLHRR